MGRVSVAKKWGINLSLSGTSILRTAQSWRWPVSTGFRL